MAKLWPDALAIENNTLAKLANQVWSDMPSAWQQQISDCWLPLANHVAHFSVKYMKEHQQPAVIGIHGGQGSGKSTLCRALAELYRQALDWKVAVISIDDLYLTKDQRQQLAQDIHPLLSTRGVPGTHDVTAGIELFEQLRALATNKYLSYPAFDKVRDDRCPAENWHGISGPIDLILFEGWCVGCKPAAEAELHTAINSLEQSEDSDGQWRYWVNQQLALNYQHWFDQIDCLLMLKVPGIDSVNQWRTQQEADNVKASPGSHGMTEAEIKRFVQHYQRLTERALKEMPGYADLVLELNNLHQVSSVHYNQSQTTPVEESV